VRSVSPAVLAARAQVIATVDVRRELRECPVPLLYLQAANDRVVPARCSEIVKAIRPDAGVVRLTGPHLLFQAAPAECATILESFCRRGV
jgi:pimeloyl-ACP methyl ester carboxylesterase